MAGVQFYLPVPITHTLGCTGPLFIFLIQYLLGGVQMTKKQIIGVSIAFLGILFVANGR
jgi:drug/metabolite transporter (DMT)-like permease